MTERNLNLAVDQAYLEMPEAWYENKKSVLLLAGLSGVLTLLVNRDLLNIENLTPHLVAAALYTIGSLADKISTAKNFDVSAKLEEAGIHAIEEMNPLLSGIKSSRQYYRDPRVWIKEGLALPVAAVITPLGIAWGIGRGCMAMNNFKLARRANRITELALSEEFRQPSP